ncbi:hypothetical protein JW921_05460 [Candidatus Fermentibacterales bacterium]|nr:hypothetical protein [Candidatus Fermentibacterales bacterium]
MAGDVVSMRCPMCGAPLRGTEGSYVVTCIYCDSECRLASKQAEDQAREAAAMYGRAREAEEIEAEVRPLIEELDGKMSCALESGDDEAAVRYFEGMMRLETRSAQHLMGDSFDYLDQVVVPAVRDFARSLGVDYDPSVASGD